MLVSIIIPVYNIEKYLSRCLKSVINQTYKNLEIIIINDGSTDKSLFIANKFASDQRVKIYTQKNRGLSAARNYGISLASGEYISLVDGDDYIAPDFIKNLVAGIKNVDLVVSGYQTIYPDQKPEIITLKNRVTTGKSATIELLTKQEDYQVLAWNKLYAKKLFKDIFYPEGKNHEDNLTTYKLLASAKKVRFVPYADYSYYKRKNSITSTAKISDSLNLKLLAATEAKDYFKAEQQLLEASKIAELLARLAYLDNILSKKISDPSRKIFKDFRQQILESSHDLKSNTFLTLKLRIYIFMLNSPRAFLYRLFRKIKHS